jgi:hypothetical protein
MRNRRIKIKHGNAGHRQCKVLLCPMCLVTAMFSRPGHSSSGRRTMLDTASIIPEVSVTDIGPKTLEGRRSLPALPALFAQLPCAFGVTAR